MAPKSSPAPSARIPLLQFIVALLLIKSKPHGLSRKDYFLQLCSGIQGGVRPHHDSSALSYVDTAAHWKAEYQKSEDAQSILRARITELERELHARKGDETSVPFITPSKRKRGGKGLGRASSNQTQKKLKIASSAPPAGMSHTVLDEQSIYSTRSPSAIAGTDLLHHFYLLQQLVSHPMPDPVHLAGALCRTADASCRVITEIRCSHEGQIVTVDMTSRHELAPQQTNIPEDPISGAGSAEQSCIAIVRLFPELLYGMDRLSQLRGCTNLEQRIVHGYVKMFRCLLEKICQLSTNPAAENLPQFPSTTQSGQTQTQTQTQTQAQTRRKLPKCMVCSGRKLKCDQRANSCRYCKKKNFECDRALPLTSAAMEPSTQPPELLEKMIIKLCESTVRMMRHLDTKKATHNEILEGFLYFLFERIGQGLRQFVFGPGDDDDVGADQPGNAESTQPPQSSPDTAKSETPALKAQAPYLIWILEQTQTFLHRHQNSHTDLTTQAATTPTTNVAAFTRTKLQYTLLKAIFGDRAPSTYEPALNPPATPTEDELRDLAMPKADVKDWYKHEVWRLLGWDVLRDHRWEES